jgi:hypothetical protein
VGGVVGAGCIFWFVDRCRCALSARDRWYRRPLPYSRRVQCSPVGALQVGQDTVSASVMFLAVSVRFVVWVSSLVVGMWLPIRSLLRFPGLVTCDQWGLVVVGCICWGLCTGWGLQIGRVGGWFRELVGSRAGLVLVGAVCAVVSSRPPRRSIGELARSWSLSDSHLPDLAGELARAAASWRAGVVFR